MLKFLTKNRPKIKRKKAREGASTGDQQKHDPKNSSSSSSINEPQDTKNDISNPPTSVAESSSQNANESGKKEQQFDSTHQSVKTADPALDASPLPPPTPLEKAQALYQKSLEEAKQRDVDQEHDFSVPSKSNETAEILAESSENPAFIRPKKVVPNDAMAALASVMRGSAARRTVLVSKDAPVTSDPTPVSESISAPSPPSVASKPTKTSDNVPVDALPSDVSPSQPPQPLPPVIMPRPPPRRDASIPSLPNSRAQSMVIVPNENREPPVPPRPKSLAADHGVLESTSGSLHSLHKPVLPISQQNQRADLHDSDDSIVPTRERGESVTTLTQQQSKSQTQDISTRILPPVQDAGEVSGSSHSVLDSMSQIQGGVPQDNHSAMSEDVHQIMGSLTSTKAVLSAELTASYSHLSTEHPAPIASSEDLANSTSAQVSSSQAPPLSRPRSVVFQDQPEHQEKRLSQHGPAPPPPILEPSPASSAHGSLSEGLNDGAIGTESHRSSQQSIQPRRRPPSVPTRPKSMADGRGADGLQEPLPPRPKTVVTDSDILRRESVVSFAEDIQIIPAKLSESSAPLPEKAASVTEVRSTIQEFPSEDASKPIPLRPAEVSSGRITNEDEKRRPKSVVETTGSQQEVILPPHPQSIDFESDDKGSPSDPKSLNPPGEADNPVAAIQENEEALTSTSSQENTHVSNELPARRIPGLATQNAALGALAAAMKSGLGRVPRQSSYGTESVHSNSETPTGTLERGRIQKMMSTDSTDSLSSPRRDLSTSPIKNSSPTKSPNRFQFTSPTGPSLHFKKKDNSLSGDDKAIEKAAIQWLNHHLADKSIQVEDLYTNLGDGLYLIYALESRGGESVGKYNRRAMMPIHKLDNIAVALKYLSKKGVNTAFLTPQDVLDANKNKILALFSHILRTFPLP